MLTPSINQKLELKKERTFQLRFPNNNSEIVKSIDNYSFDVNKRYNLPPSKNMPPKNYMNNKRNMNETNINNNIPLKKRFKVCNIIYNNRILIK